MATPCDQLIGRLRELCEGTANLPLPIINKYREHWGQPPLTEETRPVVYVEPIHKTRQKTLRLDGIGPGSELIRMYTEKGMPHCEACYQLACLMDAWGPDECTARLDGIVADIFPRAKQWVAENRPWINRLLPAIVKDPEIHRRIRSDVAEAIASSRMLIASAPPRPQKAATTRATRPIQSNPCPGCNGSSKQAKGRRSGHNIHWAYGITATPSRSHTHLPRTVASLEMAGFSSPTIFMDDGNDFNATSFAGCMIVRRSIKLGAFGNFALTAWELYTRQPDADRFIIFQDDIVCYRNLREYLGSNTYQPKTYYNLYTWPCNVKSELGWSTSNQRGHGALATMFDNDTLRDLLSTKSFIDHRQNHYGHKGIDKAVMVALKSKGYSEIVHNPSLVQHTGVVSTIQNGSKLTSPVFRGEDFDAMTLLQPQVIA